MKRIIDWAIPALIAPNAADTERIRQENVFAVLDYNEWVINRNLALIEKHVARAEILARQLGIRP